MYYSFNNFFVFLSKKHCRVFFNDCMNVFQSISNKPKLPVLTCTVTGFSHPTRYVSDCLQTKLYDFHYTYFDSGLPSTFVLEFFLPYPPSTYSIIPHVPFWSLPHPLWSASHPILVHQEGTLSPKKTFIYCCKSYVSVLALCLGSANLLGIVVSLTCLTFFQFLERQI